MKNYPIILLSFALVVFSILMMRSTNPYMYEKSVHGTIENGDTLILYTLTLQESHFTNPTYWYDEDYVTYIGDTIFYYTKVQYTPPFILNPLGKTSVKVIFFE